MGTTRTLQQALLRRAMSALGIVVLMSATAACGGGDAKTSGAAPRTTPTTAAVTTTATPTPTPTEAVAAPTPAARTIRIVIDPFTDKGLRPGWSIDQARSRTDVLDCAGDTGSPYAVGISTHWCGSTADSANACWTQQFSVADLWCLDSSRPSSHKLWSVRAKNVDDDTPAPRHPRPLFLELTDGSRWWARTGGAWSGRADGLNPIYGCANKLGVCASSDTGPEILILSGGNLPDIDKSAAQWRVRVGQVGQVDQSYPAPVWLGVTRTWFMAGRRWHGDS